MKVDTADSKGKWLVRVPIRFPRHRKSHRALPESPRSPRRVRERPQIGGKSREKLRSELKGRRAKKPKRNWGYRGICQL